MQLTEMQHTQCKTYSCTALAALPTTQCRWTNCFVKLMCECPSMCSASVTLKRRSVTMTRGGVMKYQLSAGCGEAALWRPLLLAQYCCQGGENNLFVKTQSHKISQLPVSASSGSSEDVIDAWPLSCERVTCDFFQTGHIVRGSASAAIPRSTCSLLGARFPPGAVSVPMASVICF